MSRIIEALNNKPYHTTKDEWDRASLQYCADDIALRVVVWGVNGDPFDLLEPVELWLADLYAMNYGNI